VLTAAQRKREQRRRERHGLVQLAIELDESVFCLALLLSRRLTEAEALRRNLVAREAGAILGEWARIWLKSHCDGQQALAPVQSRHEPDSAQGIPPGRSRPRSSS
jgi:hypothetical protein